MTSATPPPSAPPRGILLVLFLGVLMGALDIAIVGPALPDLKQAFSLDERALSWVFSSYVLANIVGAPLLGKLSDVLGRRRVYVANLLLFGLGSLVVAIAPSFFWLALGRALQGFGAGGIFPVAGATIGDVFPAERRGRMLGLIGAVFGIAFLIGPFLGAALLPFGWRWLFIINIPISLALALAASSRLPSASRSRRPPLDWPGMLWLAPALLLAALGLTNIDAGNVTSSLLSSAVWPLWLASLACTAGFLRRERRAESPVLRLDSFAKRPLAIAAGLAMGAGVTEATFVFLPPFLVSSFHIPSSRASLWLAIPVVALTFAAPLAGRLLDRLGARAVLMAGTALLTTGLFSLGLFSPSFSSYAAAALLLGAGIAALVGAPVRFLVLAESRDDEKASLQSTISLFTNMGQLLGSVFVGAMVASHAGLPVGFQSAFLGVGIVAALLFAATIALPRRRESRTPAELTGTAAES